MKILSQEQVKHTSSRREDERAERVALMRDEETAIAKRLNQAKEDEKEYKKRSLLSLAEIEASTKVKKTILEQEVASLEKRKSEAMRPVRDIQKEAEDLLAENISESKKIKKKSEDINILNDELLERVEKLDEYKDSLDERQSGIEKKELINSTAEKEIESSTKNLSQKWVEFHESVHQQNKDFLRREKDIEAMTKANEVVRESNEKEALRLSKERIAIKDGYVALEQAKKHLGIK